MKDVRKTDDLVVSHAVSAAPLANVKRTSEAFSEWLWVVKTQTDKQTQRGRHY